ncbi:hypothetical protein [uncultured Chitinophaga sp.]|jgi:hypothetical protein|uniref:hypothetical protein n=1 Tax=uncultured Chitinophaga sp. TaxID=339340 RepID=UPI0026144F35|nr:hypothetical protein [uncultured Chitinophaga sp.]
MKKTLIISTVISATLMIVAACTKEETPVQPGETFTPPLRLTDGEVKRGQTIVAWLSDSIQREWTVEPCEGVKIFPAGQSAEILFTQPGEYIVRASGNNGPVYTDTVQVADIPYTQPESQGPVSLSADDTITLEPLAFPDDVLVFHARGKKGYSCLPLLVYQQNTTASALHIDFIGTPSTAAVTCTPGPYSPPHGFVYTRGYDNGTHPVTIRLGTALTAYTGTVTVTDDKFSFSWPDGIPVVIAPKVVSRVR